MDNHIGKLNLSERIKLVAEHLLKMYGLLHPYSPFANEETKTLAYNLGFREGSIDLDRLSKVYDSPNIQVPDEQELPKQNKLALLGQAFLKSLESDIATDYFKRYGSIVADYDRDLLTCELDENDDMNWLLSSLETLKLDDNWLLDNTGGVSMELYVRPRGTKRPPVGPCDISSFLSEHLHPYVIPKEEIESPFKHIKLPFTRKALWQVYLLYCSTLIFGQSGHGCYDIHRFVFDESDLRKNEGKRDDTFNLKENKPLIRYLLGKDLYPTIITDTTYAMITHYWINDWKGLYKTHMILKYDIASYTITDWYRVDEEPLIRYNCGVWY